MLVNQTDVEDSPDLEDEAFRALQYPPFFGMFTGAVIDSPLITRHTKENIVNHCLLLIEDGSVEPPTNVFKIAYWKHLRHPMDERMVDRLCYYMIRVPEKDDQRTESISHIAGVSKIVNNFLENDEKLDFYFKLILSARTIISYQARGFMINWMADDKNINLKLRNIDFAVKQQNPFSAENWKGDSTVNGIDIFMRLYASEMRAESLYWLVRLGVYEVSDLKRLLTPDICRTHGGRAVCLAAIESLSQRRHLISKHHIIQALKKACLLPSISVRRQAYELWYRLDAHGALDVAARDKAKDLTRWVTARRSLLGQQGLDLAGMSPKAVLSDLEEEQTVHHQVSLF